MKAAFIGFGDLGDQVFQFIRQAYPLDKRALFDDIQLEKGNPDAIAFQQYKEDEFAGYDFFVCLGYKHLEAKNRLITELSALGRKLPYYIHPSSHVAATAQIGDGTVVYPMCNIDHNAHIGKGCLINNSVVVSHDALIGDCCYLSPGVILSGKVTIGENSFLGSGVTVSNGVKIGKNVQIGIGTLITKDIPDNVSVLGSPPRTFHRKLNIR